MDSWFRLVNVFALTLPVLYILYLNHKTFKSLNRLSDTQSYNRESRRSAYATLVRYSQLSMLTPQTVQSTSQNSQSAKTSRDLSLERALKTESDDSSTPLTKQNDPRCSRQKSQVINNSRVYDQPVMLELPAKFEEAAITGQVELLDTIVGHHLLLGRAVSAQLAQSN